MFRFPAQNLDKIEFYELLWKGNMRSEEPLEQKIYQVVFVAFAALELSNFYRFLPLIARVVFVPLALVSAHLLANVYYKKLRQK
jgi:hypothetical protein